MKKKNSNYEEKEFKISFMHANILVCFFTKCTYILVTIDDTIEYLPFCLNSCHLSIKTWYLVEKEKKRILIAERKIFILDKYYDSI